MSEFEITRIYSAENGDSHFKDLPLPLTSARTIGSLSAPEEVESISFRVVNADYDFHHAPARQYIILLDGKIEIETPLGDKRESKAGEVLLVEDTQGKGHKTHNVISAERRSILLL